METTIRSVIRFVVDLPVERERFAEDLDAQIAEEANGEMLVTGDIVVYIASSSLY